MKTHQNPGNARGKGIKIILWSLLCFPASVWAQDQGVDVDKYQDALARQIDQLKAQPATPTPAVPKARAPKNGKAEKAIREIPAPEKSAGEPAKGEEGMESLRAEMDLLAQKVKSQEGAGPGFNFGLLLQGRGTVNDNPTVKIAGNTVYEGLDDSTVPGTVHDQVFFRRAEMKFYGGFSKNTIQYTVMIDPVGVPAASKNLIQDYVLVLSPLPYLDFTVGQAKYPQGLEGRTSSAKLDFINRSTLGGGNGFGDQRDVLAQVSGSKVPLLPGFTLDYALAAVNGQGRNNPENNDTKDIAARLGFQYKNFWAGASAYDGYEQALGAAAPLEMWRAGAECQLVLTGLFQAKDNLKFQAEWGQGSLVNENGTTKAAFTAVSGATGASGFYAQALYRLDNTRFGGRYELWDPRDSGLNSPGFFQNLLTLGVDQYFSEDHGRLSLNWIHPILDNPAGGTLAVGEVVEGQVQLFF